MLHSCSLKSVPSVRLHDDVIQTDAVSHATSVAPEHETQRIRAADRLERAPGLIPHPGADPRRATPRRDAADGVLERILHRDTAGVVLRLAEPEVRGDAIVPAGAGPHRLDEGFAAPVAGKVCVEGGCKGVSTAKVDAVGRGKGVGGGAEEFDYGPGVAAGCRGCHAGFEAAVGDDIGGRASPGFDWGGSDGWDEGGEKGKNVVEMHLKWV